MRITFVCTGNTCRSVMAEKVFNKMLRDKGIEGAMADSAGTAAMSHYSIYGDLELVFDEKGVEHGGHTPRRVDRAIMEEADLVLVMTRGHREFLLEFFPEHSGKVYMLSEYAEGTEEDVPDPIGQGVEAYRRAYCEIERYLENVIERIRDELAR